MTKNRLSELRALQIDDKKELKVSLDHTRFMKEFRNKVNIIQDNICLIQKLVNKLIQLYSGFLTSATIDDKVKDELGELMDEIKTNAQLVRLKLKALEVDMNKGEHQRIKKTQISYLLRSLTSIMSEYNAVQIEHRDKCRRRIIRQLEIAGRRIDEDEVELFLDSGNPQIFTHEMIVQSQQAKQTLIGVQERNKDILTLEQSIVELFDMFNELAMLIESQGHMLDNIEYNVLNIEESAKVAEKNIRKALTKKWKARKKKTGLALAGSIALAVVLVMLL